MRKSHNYERSFNDKKKHREREWKREHDAGGFRCSHCKQWVIINDYIGTANRNHCPLCLWSKHVDERKGDREADCNGGMKPIGLTFKHEGFARRGELMLVHECAECGKISINRIARDDGSDGILRVFAASCRDDQLAARLATWQIYLLGEADEREVRVQLFGQ